MEMVGPWPDHFALKTEPFVAVAEVVTTFNALTQLDDKTLHEVSSCDGIHVVPNLGQMNKTVKTTPIGDGWQLTEVGGKTYKERVIDCRDELSMNTFYSGINTYAEEQLVFNVVGAAQGEIKYRGPTRITTELFEGVCTKKYDGEFVQVAAVSGRFTLLNRLGVGVHGNVNSDHPMLLEFEDCGEFMVLLRVARWRGYRPFHSIAGLSLFVKKKLQSFAGVPVIAPEIFHPPRLTMLPTMECPWIWLVV